MLLAGGEPDILDSRVRAHVAAAHATWGAATFACVCAKFALIGCAIVYAAAATVAYFLLFEERPKSE